MFRSLALSLAALFLLCSPGAEAFVLSSTGALAFPGLRSPPLSSSKLGLQLHKPSQHRKGGLGSLKAQLNLGNEVELASQLFSSLQDGTAASLLMAAEEAAKETSKFGYEYSGAQTSYYASLGLYVLSFPGLWSLVKRSVQYKPIKKVYVTEGPEAGKEVRTTAAEITAYFRALNFSPEPSSDSIVFRGTMGRSSSQAFFLTFCTFMGLASLALVLSVTNPLVDDPSKFSPWWYITLASPYAGLYYWQKAEKDVTVQLKMEEVNDGKEVEVTTLGTKEELERFVEAMGFSEKGKIRVPGLMETMSELVD